LFREKIKVKGKSGIVHVVEVVKLGDEKYIYIDLERESAVKVLSKIILGYDTGLKIYVKAKKLRWDFIEEALGKLGGIVDVSDAFVKVPTIA